MGYIRGPYRIIICQTNKYIKMGFFDKERAEEAFNRTPTANLNKMLDEANFTKYNEFKVSDHRNSFELKRIADSLEQIAQLLNR